MYQTQVRAQMQQEEKSLEKRYLDGREASLALKYRLRRRATEISSAIRRHFPHPTAILDVGVAEGKEISHIESDFPNSWFVGLDSSRELLRSFEPNLTHVPRLQALASKMPYGDGVFDTVIAAATIEHIARVDAFVKEVHRVLKPNGGWILTTPDPFWDSLAAKLGFHLDSGHDQTYGKAALHYLCNAHGFRVLEYSKFMVSPIGMPLEENVEQVMTGLGLTALMANQLLVAMRV